MSRFKIIQLKKKALEFKDRAHNVSTHEESHYFSRNEIIEFMTDVISILDEHEAQSKRIEELDKTNKSLSDESLERSQRMRSIYELTTPVARQAFNR